MRRLLLPACLALVAVLAAAACGDDEETTPKNTSTASPSGSTVTLEADDFYFKPAELTANAGKTLTVEVQNEGKATHTFTIDALNIDQTLSPDQKATVTIPAQKDGTFAFYCRFHRDSNGMKGTLKVGAGASGSASPTSTKSSSGPGFGY